MIKGKIGLLVVMLFCFFNVDTYAQGRDCCFRHAIYSKCTVDDIKNVDRYGEVHCDSVKNCLTELMIRDCFRVIKPKVFDTSGEQENSDGQVYRLKPTIIPAHEYSFDVNFVSGLNEFTDEGRPIRSSLTISMYFEGEQRELVHCWKIQGTWDTISNSRISWMEHRNKLERCYKKGPDIFEIIKRFEKKPTSCQIKLEKKVVNVNEEIEFELSDFRDVFGESSRAFNRIIVHTSSGEIMNGGESYIGPYYKVFRVDDGTITVKYRAPDNYKENSERITVYSSCDVLPNVRVPMSSAEIYKQIKERIIVIKP